jgi:hypothetical protein
LQQIVHHLGLGAGLFAVLIVGSLPGTASALSESAPVVVVLQPKIATGVLDVWSEDIEPAGGPPVAVEVQGLTIARPEPALPPSILETHQIISYYGYPKIQGMGELGRHDPLVAAERVKALAREYDALNGDRETVGALHLIVDVAQAMPTSDGLYLDRLDRQVIAEYVEVAREQGLLLFLDLQIGWSDAFEDTQRFEWFLREPFVHLALDPEFATARYGAAPGRVIGSLDADQVNQVQAYLGELVQDAGIPPKILVLHQFQRRMLIEPERYSDVPEVELTIDMDGFGGVGPKIGGYQLFALADYAERSAFKLFYRWDEPVMTPEQVMGMDDPPDYIIYQ